ncbi:hypothetical protein SAMN05444487_11153 [Marininema mesophilum]|uniref:Probable membrane transporter protein n=1 Tax=Marininema mesophilum TaxID=1048340 RepID=A0A1H2ZGF0_9BACL|nr:sulfite exporter TauE/SafE family protein [Marininema mesophilum]SDX16387.1 hypothetical protein SAMN05444487_11153 [Marininema mesophilum]
MKKLIVFAFIGLVAQLIDGSLGMAYGLTSTSLLLVFGISPAIASASVHLSELATTAASGIAHFRFGNVDKQVVKTLIIPGSIGAFVGACFLSNLPGDLVKPYISIFLLALGVYIVYRFLFNRAQTKATRQPYSKRFLYPLGLFAGFLDATGGGGWGPFTTPVLLSRTSMEPRKVIGSVDTSEFAIASAATLGFLISLGTSGFNWLWIGALTLGGIIAAPIAAWLVKVLPSYLLGVLVGGLIIFTNLRNLVDVSKGLDSTTKTYIYALVLSLWAACIAFAVWKKWNEGSSIHQVENDA